MPGKILVVDDDGDSLKLIGLMLQRQGYEVTTAHNGQQALDAAFTYMPDLIILDVMMPDMDGYTVARTLRQDNRTVDVPILMFTAKTLVDDKVAGFEAGADDYLTKPTHPAELAARVQAILARGTAQKKQTTTVTTPPSQEATSGAARYQGQTYALIGVKGGVGLSTLATNMAAVMASYAPTTLIDFRLGRGTIGMSMGFGRSTGLANLLQLPTQDINRRTVQQEIVTHQCGLHMLLSSIRSREALIKLSPESARAIVGILMELTHHVVLDMGPGLNALTVAFARDVDRVVVAVEPNSIALAMGYDMLSELRQSGVGRDKINVVILNRTDSKTQIPWQEAEQQLDHEVTSVIAGVPDLALKAIEQQKPLILVNPNAMINLQMTKLTDEIIRRTEIK
jgi:pilus assembly protein CpaE